MYSQHSQMLLLHLLLRLLFSSWASVEQKQDQTDMQSKIKAEVWTMQFPYYSL